MIDGMETQRPAATARDGRQDFDFLMGSWRVYNTRTPLAGGPAASLEFATGCEARPLLAGLGNIDSIVFTGDPGRPDLEPWEGGTVRLFDPAADLWRIYWMSTRSPGRFDAPMVGRFHEGVGTFYGEDVDGDRVARVRFTWTVEGDLGPRWEQAWRFDDDDAWRTDWVMDFEPADGKHGPPDRSPA